MSLSATGTRKISETKPHQRFKGHTNTLCGIMHLPGGQHIITGSWDGSLRSWNLGNGLQIGKDWKDGEGEIYAIALCPYGKTIASGSGDGTVRLWDIETRKVITKWTEHHSGVLSISWSRNSQRVAIGSADSTVVMWDVEGGKAILRGSIDTEHGGVYTLVYSLDDAMIASGGGNFMIRIWDAKTFDLVMTLEGHGGSLFGLAWTMGGKILVSGSYDTSVRTWNTTTREQLTLFTGHDGGVSAIAISSNDRILASASSDKTARLWNLENGRPIGPPLQHTSNVTCISFSADGRLLVTGCYDHNAYTWNVSAIVKEAGYNHLLSDSNALQKTFRKSVLDTDVNQHLPKPLNNARRLPQGFFDDTGDHTQSYSTHPRAGLSARSRPAVRGATSHGITTLFRPLNLILPYFSRSRRSCNEQWLPEVEVPYTRGQARNVHAAQRPKDTNLVPNNIMTLTVTGTSQPPISDTAQNSGEHVNDQHSSSQTQDGDLPNTTLVHTISTTVPVGTPVPPDAVNGQARSWTRFLCCVSSDNAANPE